MALQLFKIASTTVETPQASIDFSSIPSGYTDLVLKVSAKTNGTSEGNEAINISFNGSTTGYSSKSLHGSGGAVASFSGGTTNIRIVSGGASDTDSTKAFSNSETYIPNYTSSNYKSVSVDGVSERNAATTYCLINAGLWSNTAAITSISITKLDGTGFIAGSTATLYGVL